MSQDGDSSFEKTRESLSIQLQEIEMLQSMFPGENELVIDEPYQLDLVRSISEGGKINEQFLKYLTFYLNLPIMVEVEEECSMNLRLNIELPTLYPNVQPLVNLHSDSLSRASQSSLNQRLNLFMEELVLGDMLLLDIITWCQDNSSTYFQKKEEKLPNTENDSSTSQVSDQSFIVFYMHHIYNSNKRKDILNWARELCLTGFSLPGKPGVVYIEGCTCNVDEYHTRIKRLNWQRITCKIKESIVVPKFTDFKELCFDVHGTRENHFDMGQFYTFLKEKGLGYLFKELFGIEGHDNT